MSIARWISRFVDNSYRGLIVAGIRKPTAHRSPSDVENAAVVSGQAV
jgi:hypothetical protein